MLVLPAAQTHDKNIPDNWRSLDRRGKEKRLREGHFLEKIVSILLCNTSAVNGFTM